MLPREEGGLGWGSKKKKEKNKAAESKRKSKLPLSQKIAVLIKALSNVNFFSGIKMAARLRV